MQANTNNSFDIVVVGGGPTGFAAAASLARLGYSVGLAARELPQPPAGADRDGREQRTAALFPCTVSVLEQLGCLDSVQGVSAPLKGIRLVDMTGGLMRAPEVLFSAAEAGLPYLALNIPNSDLTHALMEAARAAGVFIFGDCAITGVEAHGDGARIMLASGSSLSARIVVAADGRKSVCRDAAGISCETWTYDQSALVCSFAHDRPHDGISTEIHHPAGPCTTVPLPGSKSSLVWVERPDVVDRLMRLTPDAFNIALHERLGGLLGGVELASPRRSFPLAAMIAARMAQGCTALVGEAGHALPPIGAQGLNLGLADVAVLADVLSGGTLGSPDDIRHALATYSQRRAGDIARRAGAVDLLNRTLVRGSTALHLMRGAGLHVLAAVPAARRTMMAQGLAPPSPIPSLMKTPAAAY